MRIILLINFYIIFGLSCASIYGQNLDGKYSYSNKNGSGEITIKEIKKSKTKRNINFKIEVGRDGGSNMFGFCVGELSGIAKEIETNIYEFNSDFNEKDEETDEAISCRLTFSFSKEILIVRESDCGYFHGAACNFEGKFIRSQKTVKRKAKNIKKN